MARPSLYEYRKDAVMDTIDTLARALGNTPPSLREVAAVVGVSVATLHNYLTMMETEGLVEWQPGHHRSLRTVRG